MDEKGTFKVFSSIIKEIGITGFVIVVVAITFLVWGTPSQKREFIDCYILFKCQNPFYCAIIVACLVLLMIIGTIYYQKMLGIRKEENNRIGKEKSKWQALVLDKPLRSSDP